MAEKGRRGTTVKTPAKLKLVEGRGRGRDSGGRPVKEPPGFMRLPPETPDWLPEAARAEWERVVPELQRLGLTKQLDAAALTAYCLAWDRLVCAQRDLEAKGLYSESKAHGTVRHPAVGIVEAASKELRAWAHEFGLTPAAEAGLATPEAGGDDENPFAGAGPG